MPRAVPFDLHLGVCGLVLAACAGSRSPALAEPDAVVKVEVAWRVEPVLRERGREVFQDAQVVMLDGQPVAAMANHAAYLGAQSLLVARRTPSDGWRVEFAKARAHRRVCAAEDGTGTIRISYGDGDLPLQAMRWDGVEAREVEPGSCDEEPLCRPHSSTGGPNWSLRCSLPAAPGVEACPPLQATTGMTLRTFDAKIDASGRLHVALAEWPDREVGLVRHALCEGDRWTSSVVAEAKATKVSFTLDGQADAHIIYDDVYPDHTQLYYATTATGTVAPSNDPRIAPALEACARVRGSVVGPPSIETYQQGDAFRCGVLERDESSLRLARAELDQRCDGDDAEACVLAGMTRDWLLARFEEALFLRQGDAVRTKGFKTGIAITSLPTERLVAGDLYLRACSLGDAQGCALAASMATPGEGWRLGAALTACQGGRAEGCALVLQTVLSPLPIATTLSQSALATARTGLELACDNGDAYACNNLGVLAVEDGRPQDATERLADACTASLQVACRNLEQLASSQAPRENGEVLEKVKTPDSRD